MISEYKKNIQGEEFENMRDTKMTAEYKKKFDD